MRKYLHEEPFFTKKNWEAFIVTFKTGIIKATISLSKGTKELSIYLSYGSDKFENRTQGLYFHN